MKRLLFILLPALLAPFAALAQSAPADPLGPVRRALAQARTDTVRARYYWLASEVVDGSDSIRYFAQRAIPLLTQAMPTARGAARRRLLGLLGGAVNNLGVGYSNFGLIARSEALFLRAAHLRQQGGDVRGQVESLLNLALALIRQRDYAGALCYCQEGVRAGERVPAAHSVVAH